MEFVDIKQKFAGSYLGVIWAFVQPIVTVFVYWFVFTKALPTGASSMRNGINVPYVVWLLGGLVPWFFFLNYGLNYRLFYMSYFSLINWSD